MRKLAVIAAIGAFAVSSSLVSAQSPLNLTFGPGRNATQPGTVTITDMGASFKVTLNMQNGIPAPGQPAHIHADTCPGAGGVVVPLTNVINGMSETTVNQRWADVAMRGKSINVHKSTTEAAIYTACVNLPVAAAAPAAGAAPAQLPRTGGMDLGLLAAFGTAFAGVGYAFRRR